MGLQVDAQGGVKYREWAPEATEARLIGEFSMSNHSTSPITSAKPCRQLVSHCESHEEIAIWCLGVLCPTLISWCLCHTPRLDGQDFHDYVLGSFH